MREIIVVPELNYWMIKIHRNSPITDTYHKIPSVISEYWREPNSVLELLFNENFSPVPQSSSSSSSGGIEPSDKPYIYKYRKCNILLIPDKNITRRLQLYRWNANVFAANSEKFLDIVDFSDTRFDPAGPSERVVEYAPSKDNTWYDPSDPKTTLPKDVKEEDRSPHITYKTKNYLSTNYPLIDMNQKEIMPPYPPDPIYPDPQNIFEFSDQDFMMLDLLYLYKTGRIVSLNGIDFNSLTCLAKMIYIYLDAFINNNFSYYSGEDTVSNGSNILCTLYEKFVLDMIYYLKYEQYGVIWEESDVINTSIKEIYSDNFMILKRAISKTLITAQIFDNMEIDITTNIPWDRKDFIIFRDGSILEQDKDFTVVVDFSDPNNPIARVHFLTDCIIVGETVEMIWSYVEPYSAFSEIDQ